MDRLWDLIENITISLLNVVSKIIGKPLGDNLEKSIIEFVKFGIVGVTNTVISYVLNILTLILLRPFNWRWDYIVGNLVGFMLSVLWSFYWNNKYVFKLEDGQHRSIGKALLKTYISYSFTGILVCNVLSILWVDVFGISKYIAPMLNLIISVPVNFIINKFWSFQAHE